ncbi:MAG TPA: hypothetical protein PKA41_04005 [Verrucomicrobiota bacterium]|nr:hypothetical protein [Verrucomicrobiota bacterium]
MSWPVARLMGTILAVFLWANAAVAQFTSGNFYEGNISFVGETNTWTFSATNGDRIVLRHARLTSTNSFSVRTRVYAPNGTLLSTQTGTVEEHAITAATNGTFTVTVADASGPLTGTGTYRLYFVKLPGAFTVPPGDDGGALPGSGEYQDGTIGSLGDLDLWTFPATAGERVVIRVAELSETNSFSTFVRIYDPSGVLLSSQTAGSVKEYAFTSATNGTFTVLMADSSGPNTGTGTYRIYFVKLPGAFTVPPGDDGGTLPGSGEFQDGTIGSLGDMDLWTFPATAGERVVIRVAELSETNSFSTFVRIYDPSGVLVSSQTAGSVKEYAFTSATNGTFTVLIADSSGPYTGTGAYRIYFVKSPGAFTIPPGDDGGALPGSGEFQDGTIGSLGDLDLWTFPATAGERVVVRVAELTETNSFSPRTRIYDPNGVLLITLGGVVDEYAFTVATNGTFTVLMADGSGPLTGTGTYRIYFVKLPGYYSVPVGDEGGELTNGVVFAGAIDLGDLDVWSFNACAGDEFTIQLDELTGGSAFLMQMRLYGRDGILLNTASHQTSVQISRSSPATGTYTLIVNDASGPLTGTGTYQLTGTGIKSGLTLCRPVITGTGIFLSAAGGITNATSILFTSTDVTTLRTSWAAILTNQFDQYGVFTRTNPFNPAEPQRYFLLEQR